MGSTLATLILVGPTSHRPLSPPFPLQTMASLQLTLGSAALLTGVQAGALTFVSFVDARTLMGAADLKNSSLIKALFPSWWRNGRDLMTTVTASAMVAHVAAYYQVPE